MRGMDTKPYQVLAQRYHLTGIVRFGSRVKGQVGPMSDVDILVSVTEPLTLAAEAGLKEELAEVLGVAEDAIDLSYTEQASGLLVTRALTEGEVLYSDVSALRRAQLRAWRRMQTEQQFRTAQEQFVRDTFTSTV